MKTLYIDCKYGISGDMTLSALINLGADMEYVITELEKLPVDTFEMAVETTESYGISGYRLLLDFLEEHKEHHHDDSHSHDHDDHHHEHRHAAEIISMIKESDLSAYVKEKSVELFEEIARAEGKIHNMKPSEVHFHEVGAMDSIIDIIGVVLAIESLAVDKIVFSAVPTGHGMIHIDHGLYPVPAPATAEILTSVPLSSFTAEGELTTPTGASFVKVLADEYVTAPEGIIGKIGYGIGTKVFEHPNVLRVYQLEDQKDQKKK